MGKVHIHSLIRVIILSVTVIFAAVIFSGYACVVLSEDLSGAVMANSSYDWSVDLATGELTGTAPEDSWIDDDNCDILWYNDEDDEFEISTAAELGGFAHILYYYEIYNEYFTDKTVKLSADIDMSAHQWVGLEFWGTLDGQGHTVSGIYFVLTDENIGEYVREIGFISYLYNGEIKNINLTNSYITYKSLNYSDYFFTAGAIVGYNNEGRIINCSARAHVESIGMLGGIVGFSLQEADPVCIHNNYFNGSLKSVTLSDPDPGLKTYLGAIAGSVYSETVYNNYAAAYAPSSESYILNAIGHIDRGWYKDIESDVRLNYCFDGGAFVADYDEENEPEDGFISEGVLLSALTEEQLLVLLNKGVDYISEYLNRPETYYLWRISEDENNGFPIFGALYPPYSVSHFLTNVSAAEGTWGEEKAIHKREYNTTLTAAVGYNLPESVIVKVEGTPLHTDGFTYNSSTGELIVYDDFVTGDISVTAEAVPKKNTFYRVEHKKQNLAGDGYETVTGDNQNLAGTTGADTAASAKSYEGFTVQTVEQQKIAGDGSTVVHILYTRNSYTLIWHAGGGTITGEYTAGSVKYEADITAPAAPSRAGYTFDGWDKAVAEEMPAENLTFTAEWILNPPTITDTAGHSGTYDGMSHSVTVTASHDLGAVTYQWYKGSISSENIIEGQTSSNITVKNISDNGTYYCRITYTDGTQIKYADSAAIEVLIAGKGNESLPVGAVIGIVAGSLVLLLIPLLLFFFLFKRTVFFFIHGKERLRIKFRFNSTIVIPEKLRYLVWFKNKEMTKPFKGARMKFRDICLYTGAGKTAPPKIEKMKGDD